MSESNLSAEPPAAGEVAVRAAFEELLASERRCPFGPRFFLEQIPTFLRDHCPDPGERLLQLVLTVQGEPVVVDGTGTAAEDALAAAGLPRRRAE